MVIGGSGCGGGGGDGILSGISRGFGGSTEGDGGCPIDTNGGKGTIGGGGIGGRRFTCVNGTIGGGAEISCLSSAGGVGAGGGGSMMGGGNGGGCAKRGAFHNVGAEKRDGRD